MFIGIGDLAIIRVIFVSLPIRAGRIVNTVRIKIMYPQEAFLVFVVPQPSQRGSSDFVGSPLCIHVPNHFFPDLVLRFIIIGFESLVQPELGIQDIGTDKCSGRIAAFLHSFR